MYNDLVKKVSEAQTPFQPMAGEELKKASEGDVTVVQEEQDGLPEDPEVFKNEADADAYYIARINDRFSTEFTTMDEALDYMNANWGSWGIRIWVTTIRKGKV